MSSLLDQVIEAHGGIARWTKVTTIDGDMSITGAMWARKGWADVLKDVHVTIETRKQWTSYRPFTAADRRSVCTPDLTVIETLDGRHLEERRSPRTAFKDHTPATPWDDLNLAYFSGYAIWNYLTTPFLFLLPGIKAEEIDPLSSNGETHRRLKVTFPDSIATHGPEQIFHVGPDNLISRMDYSAVVVGNLLTAHVMTDYRDFDGIKIATKRRAYRRNPDGTADPSLTAVAIDIADIRLS
ncbi:hypothetical protein [Bradyrhizobium prioriisuperbiae]|uniref:hypothetical protein n=1 Tax=Bradyrhizobium prioriisuperbiae TaxID=2854389 RepID=UPI0028ED0BCA|nr:hypothetical protein [Bradyrhizobium prioritasuperba]